MLVVSDDQAYKVGADKGRGQAKSERGEAERVTEGKCGVGWDSVTTRKE